MKIFRDGNLSFWLRTTLVLCGAAIIFFALIFIDKGPLMWVVAFAGLAIGSIGYYCAQAAMLGIQPFNEALRKSSSVKDTHQMSASDSEEKDALNKRHDKCRSHFV